MVNISLLTDAGYTGPYLNVTEEYPAYSSEPHTRDNSRDTDRLLQMIL